MPFQKEPGLLQVHLLAQPPADGPKSQGGATQTQKKAKKKSFILKLPVEAVIRICDLLEAKD